MKLAVIEVSFEEDSVQITCTLVVCLVPHAFEAPQNEYEQWMQYLSKVYNGDPSAPVPEGFIRFLKAVCTEKSETDRDANAQTYEPPAVLIYVLPVLVAWVFLNKANEKYIRFG